MHHSLVSKKWDLGLSIQLQKNFCIIFFKKTDPSNKAKNDSDALKELGDIREPET